MVEVNSPASARTGWFKEFGKALEPTVVTSSALSIIVGFIGGLVAQALLELIYLFKTLDCGGGNPLKWRWNLG